MSNDPDMTPVKPYDGAPDQPGIVRRDATSSRPSYPDAPVIGPANPAQWGVVVPLMHPLTVDGALLERLSIRRLTGEDVTALIMADDDDATLPRRARALACGVHPAVLGALSADDAEEVSLRLRPFLPSYLRLAEDESDMAPEWEQGDLQGTA